jgi:hypothetical protein
MSRIPRICRQPGVPAGLAPMLRPAAVAPMALANACGAASTSPGVCPTLGWLSFRRIVDIPFEAYVAVPESWLRTGPDGEMQIGQSRLRGPIGRDRDSGTCRIEARLARGPLRSRLRMRLDIDRWSSSPSSTAFELISCGRVRPTAAYFRAGHLSLDSLTRSLPQHMPTHALAAGPQSSHARITANPFLANGCQDQTTLGGRP